MFLCMAPGLQIISINSNANKICLDYKWLFLGNFFASVLKPPLLMNVDALLIASSIEVQANFGHVMDKESACITTDS